MTRLQLFATDHRLTQRQIAAGAGLSLSQVNAIVRGHQRPRTDTVNRLLAFCRTLDPAVTYELLFGDEAA